VAIYARLRAIYGIALDCLATSVTAAERFGQWSLEFQEEGVVALKLKPSISLDDGFEAPEVAFVCNQESSYVLALVAPSRGTVFGAVLMTLSGSFASYDRDDPINEYCQADY
jgi:hypothetical protein